jgi:hypothetical protein
MGYEVVGGVEVGANVVALKWVTPCLLVPLLDVENVGNA